MNRSKTLLSGLKNLQSKSKKQQQRETSSAMSNEKSKSNDSQVARWEREEWRVVAFHPT